MKSIWRKIILFSTLVLVVSSLFNFRREILVNACTDKAANNEITIKRDILCTMMGYSGYVKDVVSDNSGSIYIVMKSGRRILYDDKKMKSAEEKLNNPDLQDMFEQIYPLTDITSLMEQDFDPGRIRVYPLMNEVYGASRDKVQSNLVNVNAGHGNFQFNRNNKAAEALKCVMKEISSSMKAGAKIGDIFPASGTFNYRLVAGTGRLSPHAFGTAIDLKSNKHDYWKWTTRESGQRRLKAYSREVVQIFEKHGFIWGGKWGHFDILHFEYRPELILKSRYFSTENDTDEPWYGTVPKEDTEVKGYIEAIDREIQ